MSINILGAVVWVLVWGVVFTIVLPCTNSLKAPWRQALYVLAVLLALLTLLPVLGLPGAALRIGLV